jgi:hypothetical protein
VEVEVEVEGVVVDVVGAVGTVVEQEDLAGDSIHPITFRNMDTQHLQTTHRWDKAIDVSKDTKERPEEAGILDLATVRMALDLAIVSLDSRRHPGLKQAAMSHHSHYRNPRQQQQQRRSSQENTTDLQHPPPLQQLQLLEPRGMDTHIQVNVHSDPRRSFRTFGLHHLAPRHTMVIHILEPRQYLLQAMDIRHSRILLYKGLRQGTTALPLDSHTMATLQRQDSPSPHLHLHQVPLVINNAHLIHRRHTFIARRHQQGFLHIDNTAVQDHRIFKVRRNLPTEEDGGIIEGIEGIEGIEEATAMQCRSRAMRADVGRTMVLNKAAKQKIEI